MSVGKLILYKNCKYIICPELQQNAFSVPFRKVGVFRKVCVADYGTILGARTGK
jgi:hypothetical protein